MAQQTINVGTADKGNGDPLRTAFIKVNNNFNELYAALGADFENLETHLIPKDDDVYDLGSPTRQWRSLYVSGSTIYVGGNALGIDNQGELVWNGSRIAHAGGEYITLDSLTDVNANSPNAGDTIAWNGGAWVNVTLPTLTSQLTNDSGFLTAAVLNNGLDADIKGSVFADDSTLLVDGVSGKIVGYVENDRFNVDGSTYQIRVGSGAGATSQSNDAIAIGEGAGNYQQGTRSVAIGRGSGNADQGISAVGIGFCAGGAEQGDYAIAIGFKAGRGPMAGDPDPAQPNNSIIINASGDKLNGTNSGLYIDPVREDTGNTAKSVYYNTTTKELTYADPTGGSGDSLLSDNNDITVEIDNAGTPGNTLTWTFGTDGNLTLPRGDIVSSDDISLIINSVDSTSYRWKFNQLGFVEIPNVNNQLGGTIGDTFANGGITIAASEAAGSYVELTNGDQTAGIYVQGDSTTTGANDVQVAIYTNNSGGMEFTGDGNAQLLGDLNLNNGVIKSVKGIDERTTGSFSAGVLTINNNQRNGDVRNFNTSGGFPFPPLFTANFTVNLTGFTLQQDHFTTVRVEIEQHSSAGYYPSVLQIDGVAQTINWEGGVNPAPIGGTRDLAVFYIRNTSATIIPAYSVIGHYIGGNQTRFDGDVTGSVFADDSTLLVDGVSGVLRANVNVANTWTVTTGDKTWSFIYGDIGEGTIPTLEFPGNLQAAQSQTSIFARTGDLSGSWGMLIDAANSPYNVDIGDINGASYWRFSGDGSITFPDTTVQTTAYTGPQTSLIGAVDNNVLIRTSETLVTNNLYTNTTDFVTDIDPSLGFVISGWSQRNETEIELNLFVPGLGSFYTFLTGLALGRTVVVTYSTTGGNQTFTSTVSQVFSAIAQFDPVSGWQRTTGRILGTLPVNQTGIVSVNFPVTTTPQRDWTFSDTGNLQVPNNTTIIHDGFTIGSEGSYAFVDIPNNANSNLNDGLRISNQNGPVSITSFLQSPGIVRTWTFNPNGGLELPGGGALATSSYDVGLLAGNDGNSTFGSVTINTQFSPVVYTVTQEGGFVGGPGANTITGNISNSPSANFIVAGMTVTGLNLIGVTTVTSATVDMSGNFTITTDADEVDPFAFNEVYTFTGAEPQDRNWEFNSLGELNLPQGGVIQETTVTNELWGTTTTSMTLVPGGAGNGTQRLEIYATGGGEGDHIHITSGDQNQTDLFLGNDTQYFAVAASGENRIQARDGTNSPSPGTSAGPGANVNIYGGNAGDNGGNVADGASGGDVFLQSGISTSGLGGSIYLASSSGPDGFGFIRISTDGGGTNWTFNEANELVFPDSTTQTTAWTKSAAAVQSSAPSSPVTGQLWYDTDDGNTYIWTGSAWVDSNPAAAAPTVDITDTNGLTTTYYPTFVESRTSGQYVRADVDLTYRTDTNTLTAGNLTTGILRIEDGAHEKFQTKADATGVVTHDCSSGHVFYHTSPDANWTVNLTNLNLSTGYATAVTLVIVQGGTGYYPSAVQIGGVGQTLNWQGNTTPTPSTNRTDVVTFSIINNSGTYTVLGQLTGF